MEACERLDYRVPRSRFCPPGGIDRVGFGNHANWSRWENRLADAGRGGYMDRGRIAVLGFLAMMLVSDEVPVSTVSPVPHEAVARRFDAEAVGSILERVNPALPPSERQRIGAAVVRYSEKYGIDPKLVTAVLLVESNGRPWARSQKGAIGLMQVMPYVARPLGLAGNLATVETNVEAGCIILADNIRRLGEEDGISAYFWGSDIRGAAYLDRVLAARAAVARLSES